MLELLSNLWEKYSSILTVILGSIGSGILLFINIRNKRKEKLSEAKKAFESLWIDSSELQYEDISGREQQKTIGELSTHSHLPTQINGCLDECKNILLVGASLSGKSHFTVNFLQNLEETIVLVPNLSNFDKYYDGILKPKVDARYKIILIDDAHFCISLGIAKEKIWDFIENANKEGYIVWLITTDIDCGNLQEFLSTKILNNFSQLEIKKTLSRDEAVAIAKNNDIDKLPEHFDGTVGSIFYDIDNIRSVYNSKNITSTDRIIMEAITRLYLLGIYEQPFKIHVHNIFAVIQKIEKINIEDKEILSRIDNLLKHGLLLKYDSNHYIYFEECYLNALIVRGVNGLRPEMQVKNFMERYSVYFPAHAASYTQEMQQSEDYKNAKAIYHEMISRRVQPNTRPYTVLIRLSEDTDEGLIWLDEMDRHKIQPTDYTINALFRTTAGDEDKIDKVVKRLQKRYPDLEDIIKECHSGYLLSLLNQKLKDTDFETTLKIYDEIEENGLQPNELTFFYIINNAPDYSAAKEFFEKKIRDHITKDNANILYGNLISKSQNFEVGLELLKEILYMEAEPEVHLLGTLMNLAGNYRKGSQFLEYIKENGFALNKEIYGTLINLCKDFTECERLFSEMEIIERPGEAEYGTIINKAPDYKTAEKYYSDMREKIARIGIKTYGAMINKCEEYSTAFFYFQEMKETVILEEQEPVSINKIYSTLINKCGDFTEGERLFNELKGLVGVPDESAYGTLISKAADKGTCEKYYREIIDNNIKPGDKTYATIIRKLNDYERGREIIERIAKTGNKPGINSYNALIKISGSYGQGVAIIAEMESKGIKPNTMTINNLIGLCGKAGYDMAIRIMEEDFKKYGIKPDTHTYWTLILISPDFDRAYGNLQKLIEKGCKEWYIPWRKLETLAGNNEDYKFKLEEIRKSKKK
ncbi:MAG: hypothetical protein LUF87_11550 [Alistipes sp.]|nr:hypothetical protein [Alistipes sp.]